MRKQKKKSNDIESKLISTPKQSLKRYLHSCFSFYFCFLAIIIIIIIVIIACLSH